jgi:hypothetical protein
VFPAKVLSTFLALALFVLPFSHLKAAEPNLPTHARSPITAALVAGDRRLVVANQRSGTLSLIDCEKLEVIGEIPIGERLSHLVALDDRRLLVTDEVANELIAVEYRDDTLVVRSRSRTGHAPARLAANSKVNLAIVSFPWARQVDVVAIDWNPAAVTLCRRQRVRLNFSPGELAITSEGSAVVVDAFGGHLAIADHLSILPSDPNSFREVSRLPTHNMCGLTLSRDETGFALLAHFRPRPTLRDPKRSQQAQQVRLDFKFAQFEVRGTNLTGLAERIAFTINDPNGPGRGDPSAAVHLRNDHLAIAYAGSNELVISENGFRPNAYSTGVRPVAGLADTALKRIYVINQLSDSISVYDLTRDNHEKIVSVQAKNISLGPAPPLTPADRGERLFYDARLSADGWMSCHSCHTDGHTSGILADTLGDGGYGAPKRTPTLLGTRLTDPWAWNGSQRELGGQVHQSLATTLHTTDITPEQVNDLTAFLHTLPPPPPLKPLMDEPEDIAQLARGKAIFAREGCAQCHVPPLTFTSPDIYDVGLEDEAGNRKFNPPSLRGVSQNYRFFHDGRAHSLEAVFTEHAHMLKSTLTDGDVHDLVRYLESL